MPDSKLAASLRTPLCDLLGCDVPILLAGMGGVSRWELAAAVANAGGYGMLGMVRESPALITEEVTALKAATDRPFAVNVIPAATEPQLLEAQIACCLDLGVPAFTFFWDVMPEVVARVKRAGCLVLHQVGTVEAARIAEDAGADVIIAQGVEAGGHVHGRSPVFALTQAILNAVKVPVVATGGLASGADLASANAAFVFCYALGMLVGPQTIGVAMDVAGHHGFAWALAFFFGLYVLLTVFRIVLAPKRA